MKNVYNSIQNFLCYIKLEFLNLLSNDINNVEIYCSSDRSQKAHGAVYLREQDDNEVSVNLVVPKGRIVPAKKIALPHLELLSALFTACLGSEAKLTHNSKCNHSSTMYLWKTLTTLSVIIVFLKGEITETTSFKDIHFIYIKLYYLNHIIN